MLALIALIILAIPFGIIAILIKIDSDGPVFFKQKRSGRYRNLFTIYKFRSMSISAPTSVSSNNFKNAAEYITPLGKTLRRTSIDELPQIFNILIGDMSIIGPRPVIPNEKRLLSLRDRNGSNLCRPGITGWAQINGRDVVNDAQKAKMDGYYVKNIGFWFDIKCIVKTFLVVISAHGNIDGLADMAKGHKIKNTGTAFYASVKTKSDNRTVKRKIVDKNI